MAVAVACTWAVAVAAAIACAVAVRFGVAVGFTVGEVLTTGVFCEWVAVAGGETLLLGFVCVTKNNAPALITSRSTASAMTTAIQRRLVVPARARVVRTPL